MTAEGASFAYFLTYINSIHIYTCIFTCVYIKRAKFSPVGNDAIFGRGRNESRVKKTL